MAMACDMQTCSNIGPIRVGGDGEMEITLHMHHIFKSDSSMMSRIGVFRTV